MHEDITDSFGYALYALQATKTTPKVRGWLLVFCICQAIAFPLFCWFMAAFATVFMLVNPSSVILSSILMTDFIASVGVLSLISGIVLWCRKKSGPAVAAAAQVYNLLFAGIGTYLTLHWHYFAVSLLYTVAFQFYRGKSPRVHAIYDRA